MLRCSIKAHHKDYIAEIGSQIRTDDVTEILNIIISDHKRFMSGNPPTGRTPNSATPATVETVSNSVTDEDLLSALDAEL